MNNDESKDNEIEKDLEWETHLGLDIPPRYELRKRENINYAE